MNLDDNTFTDYRAAMFNPEWFSNTVCGNCRIVCWPNRDDRKENQKLVSNSGVVVLNSVGDHIPVNQELDEVIEIDTPFLVRVAMLKEEYVKATTSSKNGNLARAPIDIEVLSYLRSYKR
jgi:hypothetical protein